MNTYKVTLPTQAVAYRSTKNTYTHAVIVRETYEGKNLGWGVIRWTSSAELAQKALRTFENRYRHTDATSPFFGSEFQMVEVETC